MSNKQRLSDDQQGFASLVVALIMIIVLSLITVGFARLARHEQQGSLDKQLATQAYDAAESGINDLQGKIPAITTYQETHHDIDPNLCLTTTQLTALGLHSTIDAVSDISYTCALVNLTPYSIVYTGVGARSIRQTAFSTSGSLDTLTVSWGSHARHNTFRPSGNKDLTPQADWGDSPAVLQFSITPLDNVNRDTLINQTFTAYLYPSTGGSGEVTYVTADSSDTAPIISGNCSGSGTYTCNVKIKGIENSVAGQYYMARVVSYYDSSDISINNLEDAGGVQLTTVDAQVQIDVTGKAKNVLKRIQIRSPLHPTNADEFPSAAIDSQGTCKRLSTSPLTAYDPGSTLYDTPTGFGDACDLTRARP